MNKSEWSWSDEQIDEIYREPSYKRKKVAMRFKLTSFNLRHETPVNQIKDALYR